MQSKQNLQQIQFFYLHHVNSLMVQGEGQTTVQLSQRVRVRVRVRSSYLSVTSAGSSLARSAADMTSADFSVLYPAVGIMKLIQVQN